MTTWDDIRTAIQNFWNWLTSTTGSVSAQFTDTLGELGSWLFGGIKWLADQLYNGLTSFGNWLYSGLSWIGDKLKEGYEAIAQWISGGLQWIGSGLSWIGQQLYSFGQWLWNGICWVARTVASAFEGFINWIWERLIGVWNDIVNRIKSWIAGINDFLNNWIKALRQKFTNIIIVNTTLPALFKSFDMFVEGKYKEGIIGIFASPIVGAVAGYVADAIIPKPQTERIMFFPELEIAPLTYSPITVEKPSKPATPPPTKIPIEPIHPPPIGYRPIVEESNSVKTQYEVYVQGVQVVSKFNSVKSQYDIILQKVTEISKSNSVKSQYEIRATTPIEVSKSNSVKSQYGTILQEVKEVSKSNLVESQYDIRATTPLEVSKAERVESVYSTEGGEVLFNNGSFETGDLTGWSKIAPTIEITKENTVGSNYSVET